MASLKVGICADWTGLEPATFPRTRDRHSNLFLIRERNLISWVNSIFISKPGINFKYIHCRLF